MKRIKQRIADLRLQKHKHFEDFYWIVRRIVQKYGTLFPRFTEKRQGSRYVFHFGESTLNPISLEKEHGARESIPRHYAKLALMGLDEVVAYIEAHLPNEAAEGEAEALAAEAEQSDEESRTLPDPEVPD